ncbi:hypothetical protein MHYP_G00102280 [Metynnis hypsauchen]
MTFIWIIIFILTPAGISAGTTVTGHRGRSVQIKCPYDSGYETYIKYLCRGECSALPWETKDIPVQSGSAEDQRFSLDDDTAARVFTINITDLRPEDGGTYWCGIKRLKPHPDLFTEILLLVKSDPPAVSPSTYPPPSVQTKSTPLSSFPSTGFIILGVCVLLLISGIALGVLGGRRNPRDVQSSGTAQRNARREKDVPDYENDAPGDRHSMATVYQSLNPKTSQSESVYHSLNPNTNQSDSV